jgi:16S rRNA (uracil1498-N3)-methyltransferase
MNFEYFYAPHGDIEGNTIVIRGEEFRHLARVLRKKAGDSILVTDGDDAMFDVVIDSVDKASATCEIRQTSMRVNEPKIHVTLAVSLLRTPSRFELFVEKATELGVRTIVPLLCERSIPKHEKHERLTKIAIAAMKQSGRCYLPRIFPATSFETVVSHSEEYGLRLIPHEKTEQSHFIGTVLQHHPNLKSVLIVVGPEGGFTDEEVELAGASNFVPVSLGPRRLRSETAAISSLSWVVGGW